MRAGESAPLAGAALAYGPFVAALGEQAAWLLDDDGPGDMLAARHRLFVRVLGLLGDLAAHAPLVLVLEDLHWADESSRELLAFLAVRLRDAPVLVVATVREEDLDSDPGAGSPRLERRPAVTRLRLARLADAEIAELVAGLLPAGASADQVAAVVSAAEGNPLYARELASAGPQGLPASISRRGARQGGRPHRGRPGRWSTRCASLTAGCPMNCWPPPSRCPRSGCSTAAREAVGSDCWSRAGDGYAFRARADPAGALRRSAAG